MQEKNPYFDPRVTSSKLNRKSRQLKFHGIDLKAGKHVKEAERMRAKVAEAELAEVNTTAHQCGCEARTAMGV